MAAVRPARDSTSRRHPDEALLLRLVYVVLTFGSLGAAGFWVAAASEDRASLSGAAAVVILNMFATALYRHWAARRLRADPLADQTSWPEVPRGEVVEALDVVPEPDGRSSVQFLRLLVESQALVLRLAEVWAPLSRSTAITSTFTIRLIGDEGSLQVVPLVRRRRRVTEEGLAVSDGGGTPLHVLPKAEVIAFTVLVLRQVLRTVSPGVERGFRQSVELDVIDVLRSNGFVDFQPGSLLDRVESALRSLAPGDLRVTAAIRAVRALAFYDFVCVTARLPAGNERSALERRPIRTPRAISRARARSRVLQFVVRRRLIFYFDRPVGRAQGVIAAVRSAFGIPVSTMFVRLDDAHRARSYHAEVAGPEGTFLARQVVYDRDNEPAPPPGAGGQGDDARLQVPLRRLGQRHAHLYLRTATPLTDWTYATTFYERMPSSLAPVAVAAIALAVLAGLGLTTRLLTSAHVPGATTSLLGQAGFAVSLLGVPSAIAIWSGVQNQRSSSGIGGLLARAGTAVTIVLAIVAVVVNLEFSTSTSAWVAVTWLTALNAVGAVIAWAARARFVHDLAYSPVPAGLRIPLPKTEG